MIVASTSGRQSAVANFADHLRTNWPTGVPPQIRISVIDEFDGLRLSSVDCVFVIVDEPIEKQRLLNAIETLDEIGIPVVAVLEENSIPCNEIEFAGALTLGPNISAEQRVACVAGVVQRQARVRSLQQEVSVAQKFHGGLRGQIDRFHEELQLAATVQREFLPRVIPSIHGVELDALWRPANYVSGDLYNIIRLDEDHLGIFIADAVGHGVPAALMTMIICRSLTPKRVEADSYELVEPSEVMACLNEGLILRQGHNARFATGVYVLVNCRARTMKLAGAGHPFPLLLRENGDCEELETSGGLLGIFENEAFDQIEVTLNAGDRLILYSDGFEQAFPDPDAAEDRRRLPTHRYRDEFEALRDCPTASAMIEHIRRRLDDQAGSLHQPDDVTLITMLTPPLGHSHVFDTDDMQAASHS